MTINENISFTDYASRICLPDCSKLTVNWKNGNDVTIFEHGVIIKFFDVALFLFSSLVTGLSFHVSIITGSGVMTFSFIRDWPEIRKSEIPPSEFFPKPRDWGKLGTPKLAETPQIKCYWMLPDASTTACTVSELLRENQQGWPPPRLGLKHFGNEKSHKKNWNYSQRFLNYIKFS